MHLTIHSGTIVCPRQRKPVEADACIDCPAFRGLSRANASILCVEPAFTGRFDLLFDAPLLLREK